MFGTLPSDSQQNKNDFSLGKTHKPSEIHIIGAGFSGLVTAYYFLQYQKKFNFKIRVFEKSERVGGLINTIHTDYGMIETAANGFLDNPELRQICDQIGVKLIERSQIAKKRFIFRGVPQRLPLNMIELGWMLLKIITSVLNFSFKPKTGESIADWGRRVLGVKAREYLLIPALNGIYAGDPQKLSAQLIFSRNSLNLSDQNHSSTQLREQTKLKKSSIKKIKMLTVSPQNGMGEFCQKLYQYLINQGVEFNFNYVVESLSATQIPLSSNQQQISYRVVVNATSVQDTKQFHKAFSDIETNNMLSVTCFFDKDPSQLEGFGCVFPNVEKRHSLGVLFNNCIFPNRSRFRSETWIMGGSLHPHMIQLSDEQILNLILEDRQTAFNLKQKPLFYRVQRWPHSLPQYNLGLLDVLSRFDQSTSVGNYLGQIGLSKIIFDIKEKVEDQIRLQFQNSNLKPVDGDK